MGVPIDNVDMALALERIDAFVAAGGFHQVATVNTDFVVKALHDAELRIILRQADLVLPDGMPIVMASRWLRAPLRERVTGADLVPLLAARAARRGYRLFMLGARPDVAAAARERMERENPGLRVVGCMSPPVGSVVTMDNQSILSRIDEARPDILLVAFGNPKQEKWIHMHRDRLRVPVCVGVGGTFDFIAGATARAPGWMQRSGLEWLYRLAQEPRRLWRRYGSDLLWFGRFLAAQVRHTRSRAGAASCDLRVAECGGAVVASGAGALGRSTVPALHAAAERARAAGGLLVVDLAGVSAVDSAALGALLVMAVRGGDGGPSVRLAGAAPALRRSMDAAHVLDAVPAFATVDEALAAPTPRLEPLRATASAGCAAIRVQGPADWRVAEELRRQCAAMGDGVRQVRFDLSGASYVGVAMLAALHSERERLAARGVSVEVIEGPVVRAALARERLPGLFGGGRAATGAPCA